MFKISTKFPFWQVLVKLHICYIDVSMIMIPVIKKEDKTSKGTLVEFTGIPFTVFCNNMYINDPYIKDVSLMAFNRYTKSNYGFTCEVMQMRVAI